MTEQVNAMAQAAAADEQARENLIHMQEQMILRTASAVSHHYITRIDDEWSVALYAFSRAIDTYQTERGDFLPYAGLLIRRDLTDYYRKNAGKMGYDGNAVRVLSLNDTGGQDDDVCTPDVPDLKSDPANNTLKDEITEANEMLADYGFRFFDLTECSPQQEKTRAQCARVIRTALELPAVLSELKSTRKLPVRTLSKRAGVSGKTLDRYRKYIIMAILILSGDYPQIAGYLKFVRKEETV